MATNTKEFSDISGGYRAKGNAFTLSGKVLSSTNAVKIHSVTITCGVGDAYGRKPYVSDTTTGKTTFIGSYVKSNGDIVNMELDGGYFFYPSSRTTISSSELTKYTYENTEYYRLSGHASNFVYAEGTSTTIYATINGMNSTSNITVSNKVQARDARWGTISGDSSQVVHGISPGTSGYEEETLTFNPNTTQLAAGETFNLKVYCSGNGVLCIPSGSSVVVTYEEIEVDDPSSGKATGTVTFNTSGDYSTFTTTISASTFDDGNYNNWQYVSFPSSVQTISGSAANYMTSGYKYPSLQNIISATRSRPSDGADSLCLYNGELYFRCDGPNDISDITVEYSALFPNSITVLESGTYEHVITITGSVTPYELSSAASSQFVAGTNALVFPEISGWHLRVVPDNLPNSSIVKYATYTKIQNTTINVSGLSNDYDISVTASTSSTETICLIDDSGSFAYIDWDFTSFDSPVSTISNSCGPTMSGGFKVPTNITSIDTVYLDNLSACFSCCIYNNDVYVSQDSSSKSAANIIISGFVQKPTITSNGTYTVEGAVTINRAYDNYFAENGTISYEDNNVINIEFREYRDVNIWLVDESRSLGMVPPADNVLITITYSNGTSQSLQTPYKTGENPMYWGLSGLLTNTNAPGVTITSVKIDGIEISNKSGITIEDTTADYSIEGLSSGIFPDFKGLYGTITFINGTPPDTITCDYYATGTLQGTVVIDITDDVTNYSYGANIVQGDEWLQFPELPGWMLTTEPSNDSGVLEKNATYIYTGPWKAVIPYVYITGTGWVEYKDTRVYNSSTSTWEQYDWKVYSEVVTTSNEYGETAEAALYDTIENDDGTMVIM